MLAIVETGTKSSAESKGWNVEESVRAHLQGMESMFNNGQLAATYKFNLLDVRDKTLNVAEPGYPPGVYDTPEQEDFLVVYDAKFPGNNSYWSADHTVLVKGFSQNPDDLKRLFAHEFGHGRGCIDMYRLFVGTNDVFPGALYIPAPTIMGVGVSSGPTWDDLSIELLKESAGDPRKDLDYANEWLGSWSPEKIHLKIVNECNEPIAGASFKIYRKPHGDDEHRIKKGDPWHTALTSSEGGAALPGNPVTHGGRGLFDTFLLSVSLEGHDYLKWFTVADIAVPYRRGATESLVLNFVIRDADKYVPPEMLVCDVAAQDLATPPATLHHDDDFAKSLTIHNDGPDAVSGGVNIQFWGSVDQNVDEEDIPLGGYEKKVSIQPGQSVSVSFGGSVPPSMPFGSYYLLAEVNHIKAGVQDPDTSNNIALSAARFAVSP